MDSGGRSSEKTKAKQRRVRGADGVERVDSGVRPAAGWLRIGSTGWVGCLFAWFFLSCPDFQSFWFSVVTSDAVYFLALR